MITANKGISLYIHIPFCKRKCFYCDFPSKTNKENLMLEYINALCKEISKLKQYKINTIYIGGGTPTYLSFDCWQILGKAINNLKWSNDIEFTVECNPGTVDNKKLLLIKEIGVNRLSIGLQAWQENLLRKLGRIHTVNEFLYVYKGARALGFNNINIDLMYGIPGQKFSDWSESLEKTVSIKPEHISCYSLIVEEGTAFFRMYKENKLNLPSEEEERRMYYLTLEYLKNNQYIQYEISNFSLSGKQCIHNLVYWSLEDYLGCGVAAHSYFNGIRYKNETSIEKYISSINEKNEAIIEKYKNTIEDDMEEFMFLGLRKTSGVNILEFKEKFNVDIINVYKDTIEKHKKIGLLASNNNQLFLTKRGIEFSNIVMSDFII